jgi:hypothetical protein
MRRRSDCPPELIGRPNIPVEDRFWPRVNKTDGCWVWTGTIGFFGYGELRVNGVDTRAHRVSYELANGPIPVGMRVLHKCDNPPCVRPGHLFIGTQADNVADMWAKARGARPSADHPERLPRGELHWRAKFTDSDIVAIRAAVAAGESRRSVARRYKVGHESISKIIRGDTWKHVA